MVSQTPVLTNQQKYNPAKVTNALLSAPFTSSDIGLGKIDKTMVQEFKNYILQNYSSGKVTRNQFEAYGNMISVVDYKLAGEIFIKCLDMATTDIIRLENTKTQSNASEIARFAWLSALSVKLSYLESNEPEQINRMVARSNPDNAKENSPKQKTNEEELLYRRIIEMQLDMALGNGTNDPRRNLLKLCLEECPTRSVLDRVLRVAMRMPAEKYGDKFDIIFLNELKNEARTLNDNNHHFVSMFVCDLGKKCAENCGQTDMRNMFGNMSKKAFDGVAGVEITPDGIFKLNGKLQTSHDPLGYFDQQVKELLPSAFTFVDMMKNTSPSSK